MTGYEYHQYILNRAYDALERDPAFPGSGFPSRDRVLAQEGATMLALTGGGPDELGASNYSQHYYNPRTGEGEAPRAAAYYYDNLRFNLLDGSESGKYVAWLAHFIADLSSPYHINGMPALAAEQRLTSADGILEDSAVGFEAGQAAATLERSGLMRVERDWTDELNRWHSAHSSSPDVDWFDPWLYDGYSMAGTATSTHALWEAGAQPESEGGIAGYAADFRQSYGNGDEENVVSFAKDIAKNTDRLKDACIPGELGTGLRPGHRRRFHSMEGFFLCPPAGDLYRAGCRARC